MTLQVLRLPVAVGLLSLVAQPRDDLLRAHGILVGPVPSFASVWTRIAVAALAFLLVVLVGRRRIAPLPLLVVEAIIAGALGFVPPYLWASWLNYHPVTRALDFEFVAPLAIAWFAVAITVLVTQGRDRRATARAVLREASPRVDRSWVGGVPASLLPWLRVPALLALLALVAQQRDELPRVWVGAGNFELVWAQVTLPAFAFMLVALVGRRDRAPWSSLTLEIILAASLAFTPPHRWLDWLNWNELAHVLHFDFISPLAMAWFAIAILTAVRQRADSHRPHAP